MDSLFLHCGQQCTHTRCLLRGPPLSYATQESKWLHDNPKPKSPTIPVIIFPSYEPINRPWLFPLSIPIEMNLKWAYRLVVLGSAINHAPLISQEAASFVCRTWKASGRGSKSPHRLSLVNKSHLRQKMESSQQGDSHSHRGWGASCFI